MSILAPRQSLLGGLRNRKITTEHHQSVLMDTVHGFGMCPAYSDDSEIITCAFLQSFPGGEGTILCRRTPEEDDGKEWTSLNPTGGANGGACWCPINNKFYHGTGVHGDIADARMVVMFDPANESWEMISGFEPANEASTCGRAFYVESTEMVWVYASIGNPHRFAIIDPADGNSMTMLDDASIPGAVDFAQTSTDIWLSGGGAVTRIDTTSLAVSTVVDAQIYEDFLNAEALPGNVFEVESFSTGAIEHVSSVGQIWCVIEFEYRLNGGALTGSSRVLPINTADESLEVSGPAVPVLPTYMYYSATFDRVILGYNDVAFPPNTVFSHDPIADTFVIVEEARMTGTKGCFCGSVTKEAISAFHEGVNKIRYYDATDLGA
jgi:hypothetical protein